ncbi:MAG: hypothetical protein KC708_21595 [Anaerolineae bacterium]|nr:hypothetical protein [Anaerolineae bacterium]
MQTDPELKRIVDWLAALDSALGAMPRSNAGVVEALSARLSTLDARPDVLKEVIVQAALECPLVDTLKLVIEAAERFPEPLCDALKQALAERDALRYCVFYWLLLVRWVDVQRMYSPERLQELRGVLQTARERLNDMADD